MTELEQLSAVCMRLGAPQGQATTMAAQLLKRAEQLAGARGITKAEALEYLLNLVVQGHSGEVPPGFEPPPGGLK
jgi:hypothetical protein